MKIGGKFMSLIELEKVTTRSYSHSSSFFSFSHVDSVRRSTLIKNIVYLLFESFTGRSTLHIFSLSHQIQWCAFSNGPSNGHAFERTKRLLMNSSKVWCSIPFCKASSSLEYFVVVNANEKWASLGYHFRKISTHRIRILFFFSFHFFFFYSRLKSEMQRKRGWLLKENRRRRRKKQIHTQKCWHSCEILYCSLVSFAAHLYQKANAEGRNETNVWMI